MLVNLLHFKFHFKIIYRVPGTQKHRGAGTTLVYISGIPGSRDKIMLCTGTRTVPGMCPNFFVVVGSVAVLVSTMLIRAAVQCTRVPQGELFGTGYPGTVYPVPRRAPVYRSGSNVHIKR